MAFLALPGASAIASTPPHFMTVALDRVWKLKVTVWRSTGWSLLLEFSPGLPFPAVAPRDKRQRDKRR